MLLMVEKGIIEWLCHTIHRYAKANKKHMKDYDKNKESWYCEYCDVNNLYRWAMSQKLPVNGSKWVENTSQFNEDFIKSYNKENDRYSLEVNVKYPEKLHDLHNENWQSWKTYGKLSK